MKQVLKKILSKQANSTLVDSKLLMNLMKYNFGAKKKIDSSPATTKSPATKTAKAKPASPAKAIKVVKEKKVEKVEKSPAKTKEVKATKESKQKSPTKTKEVKATKEKKSDEKKSVTKKKNEIIEESDEVEVEIEEEEVVVPKVQRKKIAASSTPKTKKQVEPKKEVVLSEESDAENELLEISEEQKPKKPTKKVAQKAVLVPQKPAKEHFLPTSFVIDLDKNPQDLGKLPLHDDFPLNVKSFPFNDGKTDNPYDNYISSNRVSQETKSVIEEEKKYLCQNYAPIPSVIVKSRGFIMEDIDGFKYVDCLTGYGSVGFGHSNGQILREMIEQISNQQMTSRALYNNRQFQAAKLATEIFGKEKCVFMNSGVEGGETALKLARRWGYRVKKIPENQAKVVFMKNNFWGRTITACGSSDDPSRFLDFGPYDNGTYLVEYDNIPELEKLLESDPNICAVMAEPIQGEAGFIIPANDYLLKLSQLCKKHNCLYIDDEVQAGMGRTGTILATQYSLGKEILPDIIILGKSFTNGAYPVSCILANKDIMDLIGPGEHGSTYSGNPLGMSAAYAALNLFKKNNYEIVNNAYNVGGFLSVLLCQINSKFIKEVRGRGLMIGIEFHHDIPIDASDICLLLLERGLITKPTHKYNVRIAPPLNITKTEAAIIYEIFNFVLTRLDREFPEYVGHDGSKPNISISREHLQQAEEYLSNRFDNPIVYKKHNSAHINFNKQISLDLLKKITEGQIRQPMNLYTSFNLDLVNSTTENNEVELPDSLGSQLNQNQVGLKNIHEEVKEGENKVEKREEDSNSSNLNVMDQLNLGNKH